MRRNILFLALAALFASVCATHQPVDFSALCANKAPVALTRRTQIRALVEQLSSDDSSTTCSNRIKAALVELDQVVNNPDMRDVCSLEEVGKIQQFYEKFLAGGVNGGANEQDGAAIPKALKNFALGYGLKVSNLCKKNMINSLQYESEQLLTADDFDRIGLWTDEHSAISQLMNEPSDYDDLLLPRDLNRVLNEGAADGDKTDEKIFLQTATGNVIEKIQTVCENRFKPIYEQLILPLIYLSNLGFNYQGEDLEREMKEMSVNKDVHQWYRIVYLCEALNSIEIVENPDDSAKTEGTDKRLVRILSKEEAAKLKAGEKVTPRSAEKQMERVEFEPTYENRLGDEIIDGHDKNFVRMLSSFNTHKSELDRIRAKLLKKMAKFFFDRLKRGQLKFVGSMFGGQDKQQQHQQGNGGEDANDEVVRVFDDYLRRATSSEGAVSGGGPSSRKAAYEPIITRPKSKHISSWWKNYEPAFRIVFVALLLAASILFLVMMSG